VSAAKAGKTALIIDLAPKRTLPITGADVESSL